MPVKARSAKTRYRVTAEVVEAFDTCIRLLRHEHARPPGQPYGPCHICEAESAARMVLFNAFRIPPWGFYPSGVNDDPPHEDWQPHVAAEYLRAQDIRAAIIDYRDRR